MAVRNQDMDKVGAYGDAVPEGCYQFRIDKVKDDGSDKVSVVAKIQTEPLVGRSIFDNFDLTNSTALSKLKTYYKACGVAYSPTAHDPELLNSCEFFAVVEHKQSGANTYANIAPWSIRSLMEGPAVPLGMKA